MSSLDLSANFAQLLKRSVSGEKEQKRRNTFLHVTPEISGCKPAKSLT
jgi:hypothetical protein